MENSGGVHITMTPYICLLCSVSILAAFILLFNIGIPSGLRTENFYGGQKSYYPVSTLPPVVKLQRNVISSSSSSGPDDRDLHRRRVRDVRKPKPLISIRQRLELGLARARASIRRAAASHISTLPPNFSSNLSETSDQSASIYQNPRAFYRSYMEMEKRFKVYVYSEGEPPMVHYGPCKNLYTVEGRFIHEMEHAGNRFRAMDAERAHVYFLPFSITFMVKYMYRPFTYDLTPLQNFVSDYVGTVSSRYPFWNRTDGADHFMLACHDWGPHASRGNPHLYNNSIRVLCNANISEGFVPAKDVSLPEIHLLDGNIPSALLSPPPSTASRPHLAFFAGGAHGHIRPLLLHHWRDIRHDTDILVHEYLPPELDYYSLMRQSRFCLCPSGYEVASPRIVEAIYAECIPVILSENYILPFSDVLRWEAFSVRMDVRDIPRLKELLVAVSMEEYQMLMKGLRLVRRHFVLNRPAQRFDVFHMILHSIWLRRLNVNI